MNRRKSKRVRVGKITIGGAFPVVVQSMATIKTSRVQSVIRQIQRLEKAGCELIRVSVLEKKDTHAIKTIKRNISIPLCADIHFNYLLALEAIKNGADKIRINPGNISSKRELQEVVCAAKEKNIAIRIGANSGSVGTKTRIDKALAESVLKNVSLFERLRFTQLVLSVKAHDVQTTVGAYHILTTKTPYPLHLGVTAAGRGELAVVKSSIALGSLLLNGIGDTIRVSLTDDPIKEISAGYNILHSLGLRKKKYEIISCPTCGRCEINIIKLAQEVEKALQAQSIKKTKQPLRVAVMGCVVNGPGESKAADIGISGGRGFGFIFKKGKMIKKVPEQNLVSALIKEINKSRLY